MLGFLLVRTTWINSYRTPNANTNFSWIWALVVWWIENRQPGLYGAADGPIAWSGRVGSRLFGPCIIGPGRGQSDYPIGPGLGPFTGRLPRYHSYFQNSAEIFSLNSNWRPWCSFSFPLFFTLGWNPKFRLKFFILNSDQNMHFRSIFPEYRC